MGDEPRLAVCPACGQRVVVTHSMNDAAWVGIATHLHHGDWCLQHEARLNPNQDKPNGE